MSNTPRQTKAHKICKTIHGKIGDITLEAVTDTNYQDAKDLKFLNKILDLLDSCLCEIKELKRGKRIEEKQND